MKINLLQACLILISGSVFGQLNPTLNQKSSTQEVEKILGLNEHVERKSIAGLYKYFVPNFSTYPEALLKKQSLEHRGVSCFVVAMKTGNVLDIKTLLQVSD